MDEDAQAHVVSTRVRLAKGRWVRANMATVRPTIPIGLPTKFRFNVGPASQLIDGSMQINRLRRWPNTDLSLSLLYTLRKDVEFIQTFFNVVPQSSTLARIETALRDCTVFSEYCMGVTFHSDARNTR